MSIRIALHHQSVYDYDRPVAHSPQIIRLRPAPHCRTPILSYSLKVEPGEHFENWQQDPHGNFLARLVFPQPVRRLQVDVDLIAEMTVINPFDFFVESYAEQFPFTYEPWLAAEIRPYLEVEPVGPRLAALLDSIDRRPRNTVSFLVELNQRLKDAIGYMIRLAPGIQSCEETLASGAGSCRDTAWLLVQVLRNLGLAARFVSGYLVQLAADVKPLDGPAGPQEDFTDLHAWTEVYIPGAGWVGLDPTSGLLAGEGHIPLAATPDPTSAAPISGSTEPCRCEFRFNMQVARIHEDPRVTRPYSDCQWESIVAAGHLVDERLRAGDVRLTMGGEPTFVSIDDMDGAEWNTTAVGPAKLRLATDLILRLRKRFAPGGLLHFGQGKWYPGESLPRWALSCYWRTDGQPLWCDPEWLAAPGGARRHSTEDCRRFAESLAERLEVGPQWVRAAHEDVWDFLARERRLPPNVAAGDARLNDAEERARLARIVEQGVGTPVGHVLPLARQWWQARPRWVSGPWPVRSERLMLLPGDSPIGLRLPLESLPWSPPTGYPAIAPLDPFAPRAELPPQAGRLAQPQLHGRSDDWPTGGRARQARGYQEQVSAGRVERSDEGGSTAGRAVIRTALCVEPRDGVLHVFMPPLERLEDYLELVAAVEQTAAALEAPVVLEGYPPPHDHRLRHVKVTPDPGVIEVNVQPAHDWDELVENTTTLYDEARSARLGTEKFDLDGRHTGTGGGNHVVLGGPTPADSPFLRRPDLLRSLLAYWNNHPSLSYLFSGLFVGPTSQAPRVDEGRPDALYELEIAFRQIPEPEPAGYCPPWLVDRVFRHLLVDVTGNTHRAEFCIDKLYSPDSSSGRLGLVEFRAFEMPPHARMSLTQQLLLRALVARFWEAPYRQKLVHWGTTLHDRFMLPHFIWQDFCEVVEETQAAGLPISEQWFLTHLEFRFPRVGVLVQRGIEVELRQAIEPWYVLGEEAAAGGTVRFVDSSVERMQVKVSGMTPTRHVIACNGQVVPLHPTGRQGEFVAAVRYRAWQPPSCLHPTIGVDTPLVFDLVDTWLGRSIGGCTYHVAHPAGRNYETFPVNAYEAESRRAARFFAGGHTAGAMHPVERPREADYPLTLDLRRAAASQ